MTPPAGVSLVLGGFGTGKTTALVQLFGRMQSPDSKLRVVSAPSRLGPVRDGLASLAQGVPVSHTPSGVEVVQELSVQTSDGEMVDIAIPDYAGESLDAIVDNRRVPDRWRQRCAQSNRWILFVRVERMEEIPGYATPDAQPSRVADGEDVAMPLDMRLVELLQILSHERQRQGAAPRPALTVVLSCWDEVASPTNETPPSKVLDYRMPLLSSFVATNWATGELAVLGLSAQGRTLDENSPDAEFVDLGPEQMGYLIRADGSRTSDLTELLANP